MNRPRCTTLSPVRLAWFARNPYTELLPLVVGGAALAAVLAIVGLPPISIHGPQHFVGIMDPLCGMTRAVRYLARGEVANAWAYNPAVFLLAVTAGSIVLASAYGAMTGRWPLLVAARPRLTRGMVMVLVAALWVNQQMHASRLA